MGATVTCSKQAFAFRTALGGVLYLLTETTYEQNCYPHTPDESCVALGTAEDCWQWIYLSAACAADGGLRSPRGSINPLAYVKSWNALMANPQEIDGRDYKAEIEIGDRGAWRAPVPNDEDKDAARIAMVLATLKARGCEEEAQKLEAGGSVVFDLYHHGELLAEMYGPRRSNDDVKIAPWHILQPPRFTRGPNRELGVKIGPAKAAIPAMQLYRLDTPTDVTATYGYSVNMLVVDDYPPLLARECTMNRFIVKIVTKVCGTDPRGAMKMMEAFEALGDHQVAPPAPPLTLVASGTETSRYMASCIKAAMAAGATRREDGSVALTLEAGRAYDLAHQRARSAFDIFTSMEGVHVEFGAESDVRACGDLFANAA